MQAYLIDPAERTVTRVDYDGNYKSIYKLCDYDCFTTVEVDNRDALFVDDEGLLKGAVYQWTGFRGYAQPLAGKILVLGTDEEGESTSPRNPISYYQQRLCWIERLTDKAWGVSDFGARKMGVMTLEEMQDYLAEPLSSVSAWPPY